MPNSSMPVVSLRPYLGTSNSLSTTLSRTALLAAGGLVGLVAFMLRRWRPRAAGCLKQARRHPASVFWWLTSNQSTPRDLSVDTVTNAPQGFSVVSQKQVYRRFLRVEDRQVQYPDGKMADFDIIAHKDFDLCFVCVFVWNSRERTTTLIQEFSQAALPDRELVFGLPCGSLDPRKHSSLEEAAKCELSEEAHLTGGNWNRLLNVDHPGILETKWCRNRFMPFLCIDPTQDTTPQALDAEEHVNILPHVGMVELRKLMCSGEMFLPSVQTVVCALQWLEEHHML